MQIETPLPSQPLRVVLVDGDVRVRDSLAGLIGLGDGVSVVGSAGYALEGVELAVRVQADVVVVDPKLPDLEAGIGVIDTLRTRVPGVRILVMSWSDELEPTCREHGADAFVAKSAAPSELVEAVLAVAGRA
jgi:DNA-binding NarL/FixJ family response regulator